MKHYHNNNFTGAKSLVFNQVLIALHVCLTTWNKCQKDFSNFNYKGKPLSAMISQISSVHRHYSELQPSFQHNLYYHNN